MAQQLSAPSPVRAVAADPFPRLNLVFDALQLIVERTKDLCPGMKELLSAAKDLTVLLFILLLLIQHCISYLRSG